MTCPVCGGKTKIMRTLVDYETVQRKRKCLECNHKFFTEECEVASGARYREIDCELRKKRYLKKIKESL